MVESKGGRLHHVKPHGALYNDMVKDKALARAVVKLIKSIDPKLKIYTLAHSQVIDLCISEGMVPINEGFADRRYENEQQLRSRSLDGAVIHDVDAVLRQIEGFIKGEVQLHSQEITAINVESICLHSDTQGAVTLSQQIHQFLTNKNIKIG